MRVIEVMRLSAEPDVAVVASIIPATLVGAVLGYLILGPIGFMTGAVMTGAAGALLARRLAPRLA